MEFLAQVPAWIPLSADLVVILLGIVEITFGFALLSLWQKKHLVGWAVALFIRLMEIK